MMPKSPAINDSDEAAAAEKIQLTPEQLQRIIHQASDQAFNDDEIDLAELWQGLMKRKRLIFLLTSCITLMAVLSTFFIKPQYQASVELLPVSASSAGSDLMAKYGGLASLAGISLPSGGEMSLSTEALAILKSKRFLANYILEKNLKPVLFSESWDSESQSWLNEQSVIGSLKASIKSAIGSDTASTQFSYAGQEVLADGEPSVYMGVQKLKKVISVAEDSKTGLITLKIKWSDPVQAKLWANELVQRIDDMLRRKAIEEAEATILYMNEKLPSIELQDLRTIALQVIEESIKKITFAEVKKEYVFKVVDPAIVEENPVSPKKGLMVAVGFVLGLMLSIFMALILNWREQKPVGHVN